LNLSNKVIVITGASKGIGRATALAAAAGGAKVALLARDEILLRELSEEITAAGGQAFYFTGDLTSESTISSAVAAVVAHFKGVDILVNNAGLGHFKSIAEMRTEEWDQMFNLNVRSLFLMTRQCLPHLRAAGESVVVNVASLAGKNAFVGGGGYAASKHAVMGFSRCLMLEERKNGVRVLALCPGSVDTPFFDGHHGAEDPRKKKILQAGDIADTILHMIAMPQHAMISEVDIRPSNP
jgi:3-oxoacyl-[acyl-carrier protein] reductase